MAIQIQFRRGNSEQNDAFTGALGEVTVDTSQRTLRLHDGIEAGGFTLVNTSLAQILENKTLDGVAFTGEVSGDIIPDTDVTFDLGSPSNRWRDLYLSGDSIFLGNARISFSDEDGFAFSTDEANGTNVKISLDANDTDDLSEGTSNLYFTAERARNSVSASGDLSYNSNTGVFSVTTYKSSDFDTDFNSKSTTELSEGTNLYFTTARARESISASGDLSYNSSTGVVSFTERTDQEVRDLFSASGDLSYNTGTGTFSVTTYKSSDFDADFSGKSTTDLSEGTNLYFTTARARDSISVTGDLTYDPTTGVLGVDVPEGYDSTDFDTDFGNKDTDDLSEGTNLYFTTARARDSISVTGDLTYNSTTGVLGVDVPEGYDSTDFDTDFGNKDTDDLSEGTNLYFTTARARDSISVTGDLTYNASTGVLGVNIPDTNLAMGGSGNNRTITSSTGSDVSVPVATTDDAGFMSTDDKIKLDQLDPNAIGGATISDTAPSDPDEGDLWWDSTVGILYVYYDDGDSQQWVTASVGPQGPKGDKGDQGEPGQDGPAGPPVSSSDDIEINSLGVGTAPTETTGEIVATGDITAFFSDDRLKTRVGYIENAIEKLETLTTFYYEPNEIAIELGYIKKRHIGLSAQEVEQILPEVIKPAPIDDKYLTIQYEKLVPLLIAAIKEQQKEINDLKNWIKS